MRVEIKVETAERVVTVSTSKFPYSYVEKTYGKIILDMPAREKPLEFEVGMWVISPYQDGDQFYWSAPDRVIWADGEQVVTETLGFNSIKNANEIYLATQGEVEGEVSRRAAEDAACAQMISNGEKMAAALIASQTQADDEHSGPY